MKIAAILFFLPFAAAECPNACSGHGECGQYDSCDCYSGFQGGDCSERVCPFNWAWVTTANGDINFDGDRYDGTVYSPDVRVAQTSQSLLTQASPGGTWESWPYYHLQEEGHFYMECSNRGLCDRATGECQCFDGFDGHACNRMACPENCNGRGRCKSVSQLTGASYKKWDRDMARECVCDPGFSGPTCAERLCPYGNDVLTQVNELTEIQFIDIFTNCEAGSTCSGDTANAASGVQLGGTFTLTYTDHYGESYTTDQIALDDYDGSTQTVATATETALKALPNNVISSSLTVKAMSCYTVDEVAVDFSTAQIGSDITGNAEWTAGEYYTSSTTEGIIYDADGSVRVVDTATVANNGQANTPDAGTSTATQTVFRYSKPICLRLKISFIGMAGDLNDIVVDHSKVTYQGFSNDAHSSANIASSVTDEKALTSGKANFGMKVPTAVTVSTAGSIAAKTITMDATTFTNTQGGTATFYPGSRVEVTCTESGSARSLGQYTIASMTDTTMVFAETVVASGCTAAASTIAVTQISNIITSSGDTGVADFGDMSGIGERVGIQITAGAAHSFNSAVASVHVNKILNADTSKTAYIILQSESPTLITTDITAAAGNLFADGSGTMENNECGDRGLCDTETGECRCFAGYTGDACHIQKSIST